MILSLSWRNIWRNKTRSLVVLSAIALGLWGGVTSMALINGWIKQRTNDIFRNELSHIQIHSPEFLLNEEVDKLFAFDSVQNVLKAIPDIVGYSGRLKLFAMAQSDRANSGMYLLGVNPEDEKNISGIPESIMLGSFLEGSHRIPSLVLGKEAAEELKLVNYEITDKVIECFAERDTTLTKYLSSLSGKQFRSRSALVNELKHSLSNEKHNRWIDAIVDSSARYRLNSAVFFTFQTPQGEMQNAMFRVRGVYRTSNSSFDSRMAFVNINDLASIANIESNHVHEVAVLCSNYENANQIAKSIAEKIGHLEVRSWGQISPEIKFYTAFGDFMGLIYVMIILFALAFGIVNTTMMSVLERYREFGMLMAIGMNRFRVFSMIMLESVLLTFTGGILGLLFSAVFIKIFEISGIDFSVWAEGFEAIGYSPVVYPHITVSNYVVIVLLVILTGILASLWPARKALRLNPMQALRIE